MRKSTTSTVTIMQARSESHYIFIPSGPVRGVRAKKMSSKRVKGKDRNPSTYKKRKTNQQQQQQVPTTIPELWKCVQDALEIVKDDLEIVKDDLKIVKDDLENVTHGLHLQTEVTIRDVIRKREGEDFVLPKSLRSLTDVKEWLCKKTNKEIILHSDAMRSVGLAVSRGPNKSKENGWRLFKWAHYVVTRKDRNVQELEVNFSGIIRDTISQGHLYAYLGECKTTLTKKTFADARLQLARAFCLIDLLIRTDSHTDIIYQGVVYYIALGKSFVPSQVKKTYTYGSRTFEVEFCPMWCY